MNDQVTSKKRENNELMAVITTAIAAGIAIQGVFLTQEGFEKNDCRLQSVGFSLLLAGQSLADLVPYILSGTLPEAEVLDYLRECAASRLMAFQVYQAERLGAYQAKQ